MFECQGRFFDDQKIRPLELSRRAIRNYVNNECEVMVVTGMPEGIGKSNYISHAIADVQGWLKCHEPKKVEWMFKKCPERMAAECACKEPIPIWEPDYDAVFDYTKYLPEDVVDMLLHMIDKNIRVPMWHWDDGGTHLSAMDYTDPFVKAFMEVLPLARTFCGLVVISTPVEEWVLKKLHTATGVIHAPVIKLTDASSFWRPRRCKPYKRVRNAMHNRSFPQYQWVDDFPAMTPDSFYKRYKPIRDHYAKIAVAKMKVSLQQKKGSNKNVEFDQMVLAEVEASISKTNGKVPELMEAIAHRAAQS